MTKNKDIFERLVQQTVCSVLFGELSGPSTRERQEVADPALTIVDSSSNGPEKTATRAVSLLQLLTSSVTDGLEDPAEDDEDNNAGEAYQGSWVMECANWSINRLRAEKAAIKRYLLAQRKEDRSKAPKATSDVMITHEAYALLKLFLLERDPDYRQRLQQSIGCSRSFLKSLHVLLTLYATYFERAHGRKISDKSDLEPIQTLYDLFLTDRRASEQQSTE